MQKMYKILAIMLTATLAVAIAAMTTTSVYAQNSGQSLAPGQSGKNPGQSDGVQAPPGHAFGGNPGQCAVHSGGDPICHEQNN